MSVDMQQLHDIHQLEDDITQVERYLKDLRQQRIDRIADLDEFKALQEAQASVRAAETRLRIAVREDRELAALEVDRGEAAFKRRDLKDMLSHHLVAYHDQSGLSTVKDREARSRAIKFRASLDKPEIVNQTRIELGLSKHFGARVAIPAAPEAQHLAEAA